MRYVCMLVCFCLDVCLYIGILYAKAFSGFFMDLSSSIQLEGVGFIISGGDCWHKKAWSKRFDNPSAWRSYV